MRRTGERTLAVEIDAGLELPPGGIVIEPPVAIRAARVDGVDAPERTEQAVGVRALPARVEIEW
jgi:hypothetical protein